MIVTCLWPWNPRNLHPLSFVFPMPNHPTVPAQCWCGSGPALAFQSPWTKSISLWCCQAARRTIRPSCLHGLRLVRRPEWLQFLCGLTETRMKTSVLEIGVAADELRTMKMTLHTGVSGLLRSTSLLRSLSGVVSPNPVYLTSAKPRISHR